MIDRSLNYGRHHIKSFMENLPKCESVLDIGAGQGIDLALARRIWGDAKLFAVETYAPYVAKLSDQDIDVYSLNVEADVLPMSESSVDLVIANQILEHCKEIFWILHEVTRILPIGGHFIIGVPNLASLHNRLLLMFGKQPSPIKSNSAHVRGFTKGDILTFLESCFPGGYVLRGFGGSNFYPFPPLLAKPMARIFPTMAWGIFLLLEKKRPYNREFLEYPVSKRLETNFYLGDR